MAYSAIFKKTAGLKKTCFPTSIFAGSSKRLVPARVQKPKKNKNAASHLGGAMTLVSYPALPTFEDELRPCMDAEFLIHLSKPIPHRVPGTDAPLGDELRVGFAGADRE